MHICIDAIKVKTGVFECLFPGVANGFCFIYFENSRENTKRGNETKELNARD
jgi:hypothetical protein